MNRSRFRFYEPLPEASGNNPDGRVTAKPCFEGVARTLKRRRLTERKNEITLTEKAHELLFRDGYDPQFGARPLKRAIQRLIQDPLAMKLLDGEVVPGDSLTIDADMKKGVMTFARGGTRAARA